MEKYNYIYIVKQYWYDEDVEGDVIHFFTKEEDAIKLTRQFNLQYGKGVVLDEAGELLEVGDDENYHYYTYDKRILEDKIDEELVAEELKYKETSDDMYVIACYDKEDNSKFLGFVCEDKFTQDKNKATLYNENTVESTSYVLANEFEVMTKFFHISKADDA